MSMTIKLRKVQFYMVAVRNVCVNPLRRKMKNNNYNNIMDPWPFPAIGPVPYPIIPG